MNLVKDLINHKLETATATAIIVPGEKYSEIPFFGEGLSTHAIEGLSYIECIQIIGAAYIVGKIVKELIIPLVKEILSRLK